MLKEGAVRAAGAARKLKVRQCWRNCCPGDVCAVALVPTRWCVNNVVPVARPGHADLVVLLVTSRLGGPPFLACAQALLIEIATSWVGGKLGAELDARYKLPKMRYKGEVVEPQRIRADDK